MAPSPGAESSSLDVGTWSKLGHREPFFPREEDTGRRKLILRNEGREHVLRWVEELWERGRFSLRLCNWGLRGPVADGGKSVLRPAKATLKPWL